MAITQWTSTDHCVNFKKTQFAALKREKERGEMGERDRLAAGEKKITYPVRQLHDNRLPNHQVYLPWEVGQSLMLSC